MNFTRLAALSGASAVLCGAFGAHGLKALNLSPEKLATWQTAASYHLLHSAVLLYAAQNKRSSSCMLLSAGIVLFSGSLYGLTLTGLKWLGPITPIGGLCLVAGWLTLGDY